MFHGSALVFLTALCATAAPSSAPPNLVLIVADDLGVDLVGAYAEAPSPPCTPNIDALAASGLVFRNAWTNPKCSPTRAALLTGRHGFRTGVGSVGGALLQLSETTIPEMLVGYRSSAVGKWHLTPNFFARASLTHPNDSGFDYYAGSIRGSVEDYASWSKVVNGVQSESQTYATVDTTNEAIGQISAMREPWFLYVAYNAPHDPWHSPPSSLCPPAGCATTYCGNLGRDPTTPGMTKAMVEVMDAELGRFLNVLDATQPNTVVVFLGDNGTAQAASEPPFLPSHAKGTMYEGGLNVPLIVRGPGVVQGESQALVSCVDVFATCAELAGVPSNAEDSVSLVPYFADPALSLRATVYSETFWPNGGAVINDHHRAIRNDRYKLIRITREPDELYDLVEDPFETTSLLPATVGTVEHDNYLQLVEALDCLGVEQGPSFTSYCTAGTSASGCNAGITAQGIASASAPSGFTLRATGVEGNKDGLFYFGANGRQAVPWGSGSSYQCVTPPARRAGLTVGTGTNGRCDGFFAQDLNAFWCPTCPGFANNNPGAGAVVQAQLWYRDPFGTSSTPTGLSDALEFCVGP